MFGAFAFSADPIPYSDVGDTLEWHLDTHEEVGFLFATADGEHAVGWDGFERLGPFEVVAVFRGVLFLFLAIHDLGRNGGFLFVDLSDLASEVRIIGYALGDDIARSGESVLGGGDFLFLILADVDVFRGFLCGVGVLVFENEIC